MPRDFVEFPSQFNEHWALEPTVFANYAKHYQTGAPMPQALVEKIKKSRDVQPGLRDDRVPRRRAARHGVAHAAAPTRRSRTSNAFEADGAEAASRSTWPQVPPRYHTTYFSHIWGGGYAAGYYAYLWSEVLDDDAYYWFKEHGGMTARTASASAT